MIGGRTFGEVPLLVAYHWRQLGFYTSCSDNSMQQFGSMEGYIYMLVPIVSISPYMYRHHHTRLGPHTGMVFFLTPYEYSHKNLIVNTRFLQKICARYFLIRTEISKEKT